MVRTVFTGLIQDIGNIKEKRAVSGGVAFLIRSSFAQLTLGESIAVDGVCLTVTEVTPEGFWCELSPETLSKTVAGSYEPQQVVNLERALKMGDPLGGHWVSGHVDGTLELSGIEPKEDFCKLTFTGFNDIQRSYLFEKGSIALNGISLTLNEVNDTSLSVMIIPHTWEKTTLKTLQLNAKLNAEFDSMAKLMVQTIERYLKNTAHLREG